MAKSSKMDSSSKTDNPSKIRLSFFNVLPENSGTGKLSTISNIRLSTHFSLLPKSEESKRYSGYTDSRIPSGMKSWAGMRRTKRKLKTFCTGSKYIGEWNDLGISGEGVYRYPHGVVYDGEFNHDGLFHGIGTLTYPSGQKIQGIWKNGALTEDSTFIFACGEILDEDNKYCQKPDRRFHIEIQKDFNPAGQEYLTNDQPTKKLPEDCYDVVEGLFDPKTGCITTFPKNSSGSIDSFKKSNDFDEFFDDLDSHDEEKDLKVIFSKSYVIAETMMISTSLINKEDLYEVDGRKFLEIPCASKVEWIKKNCRKAWDENTGYHPELYEKWMTGRRHEYFLQVDDTNMDDAQPKWISSGERAIAGTSQSTNFIRFVPKKNKKDRLKNSKTTPPKHDNRQKYFDRNRNLGNIYIAN